MKRDNQSWLLIVFNIIEISGLAFFYCTMSMISLLLHEFEVKLWTSVNNMNVPRL